MTTIKNGSKGEDVKKLQKALGLTADGIFGKNTETAVKEFQKKHNLTADGIVGSATWKALGIDDTVKTNVSTNSKCIDSSVIYKPLSVHITKCARMPKYLSIHFTAGSNSKPGKALSCYNTFVSRSASADFAVDDRDIVQFNPDILNYYCWGVGDAKKASRGGGTLNGKACNKNTISIEICSTCIPATQTAVSKANHSGWTFTDAALSNAVKIAKIIMKKYNIPLERVVRHYDITGKWCPGIIGWNEETIFDLSLNKYTNKRSTSDKWIEFKNRLK